MRSLRVIGVVLTAILTLVSCSRNPEVAKKRYVESGNRYFDKGRFKEAALQYRNAIKIDARYGEAHYRLGLADLKVANPVEAVKAFRRAVELVPDTEVSHWDAVVKLTELYLGLTREKELLAEAANYCSQLLAHPPQPPRDPTDPNKDSKDPAYQDLLKNYQRAKDDYPRALEHFNTQVVPVLQKFQFDAHRLTGDLAFIRAVDHFEIFGKDHSQSERDEAFKQLDVAGQEYHLADALKPGDLGVMMQLARVMASRNEPAQAEQLWRQVIAKDKTYQTDTRFLAGNKRQGPYWELYQMLLIQGRAKDAEEVLKLAFQNNPKQYLFLTLLAAHYAAHNQRDEMLNTLQQIKSHAKDYDQAYFTVGDFYLRMGDADSALQTYREGMSKEPKRTIDYEKHIIEVLMHQNKVAEAIDINNKILKEDPNDNDARGLSATLLLHPGASTSDINKALSELQAVVTRAPDNFVARFHLGQAYYARGEREQARQSFQKAVDMQYNYMQARQWLARVQVEMGEYDAALKSAEVMTQLDPGNINARLIASAALMGQKRFADSRQLLEQMLKTVPSSPDVYFQLGMVDLQETKYKDAGDAFKRTYELDPANSRGLMMMVETDMVQNKSDEAIKLLQTESQKSPNRLDVIMALGNVEVRGGKFDAAIADYQRVLDKLDKTSRGRGEVLLRIGETYRRKGDYANAIVNLQKAKDILPENVLVLSTLGLVLDGGQRRKEAKQVYEATLKLQPDNGVVLNNLAFLITEDNGDLDQALTLAQRAKQLMPNLSEVADTLGWIYLKKSMSDQALDIFKGLVTKYPDQATYRMHLGMAFSQKGDKVRALTELKESLKYSPSDQDRQKITDMIAKLQ